MTSHNPAIVPPRAPVAVAGLELAKDARGASVHIRVKASGECLGCIEAGTFELLKALILAEKSS